MPCLHVPYYYAFHIITPAILYAAAIIIITYDIYAIIIIFISFSHTLFSFSLLWCCRPLISLLFMLIILFLPSSFFIIFMLFVHIMPRRLFSLSRRLRCQKDARCWYLILLLFPSFHWYYYYDIILRDTPIWYYWYSFSIYMLTPCQRWWYDIIMIRWYERYTKMLAFYVLLLLYIIRRRFFARKKKDARHIYAYLLLFSIFDMPPFLYFSPLLFIFAAV